MESLDTFAILLVVAASTLFYACFLDFFAAIYGRAFNYIINLMIR